MEISGVPLLLEGYDLTKLTAYKDGQFGQDPGGLDELHGDHRRLALPIEVTSPVPLAV